MYRLFRMLRNSGIVVTAFGALIALLSATAVGNAATVIVVPGTKSPISLPNTGSPLEVNVLNQQINALATDGKFTVDYPMTFWPATGLTDPTLKDSVAAGVPATIYLIENIEGPKISVGTSQGAIVLSLVKAGYTNNPDAPSPTELSFILIGNPMRPNGGFMSRFAQFGEIPIVEIPFYGATVDNQYATVDVARQYDGWADFPKDVWNLLAVANAVAGIVAYHGDYSMVSLDVNDPNNMVQVVGNTTYITRSEKLPLLQPLYNVGLNKVADELDGVLRPWIEAAYDRENPGEPTPAQFIPTPADIPRYVAAAEESVESLITSSQPQDQKDHMPSQEADVVNVEATSQDQQSEIQQPVQEQQGSSGSGALDEQQDDLKTVKQSLEDSFGDHPKVTEDDSQDQPKIKKQRQPGAGIKSALKRAHEQFHGESKSRVTRSTDEKDQGVSVSGGNEDKSSESEVDK